ncbi:MAG: hypothetical protein K2L38_04460 [Dysosmobacter sp.]|nr:hypothetical protein [Dysosmobacter sp.]
MRKRPLYQGVRFCVRKGNLRESAVEEAISCPEPGGGAEAVSVKAAQRGNIVFFHLCIESMVQTDKAEPPQGGFMKAFFSGPGSAENIMNISLFSSKAADGMASKGNHAVPLEAATEDATTVKISEQDQVSSAEHVPVDRNIMGGVLEGGAVRQIAFCGQTNLSSTGFRRDGIHRSSCRADQQQSGVCEPETISEIIPRLFKGEALKVLKAAHTHAPFPCRL